MSSALQKDLLRPSEVAEICRVTRNTVFRWLRGGLFERVRIGGATFIKGSDLRAHLNGHGEVMNEAAAEVSDDLAAEAEDMLLSFRGHQQS